MRGQVRHRPTSDTSRGAHYSSDLTINTTYSPAPARCTKSDLWYLTGYDFRSICLFRCFSQQRNLSMFRIYISSAILNGALRLLHYITLFYIALHCIILHYITLQGPELKINNILFYDLQFFECFTSAKTKMSSSIRDRDGTEREGRILIFYNILINWFENIILKVLYFLPSSTNWSLSMINNWLFNLFNLLKLESL